MTTRNKGRIGRVLVKIIAGLLATVLLLAIGLWWVLRPAEPLTVGPRLDVLTGVTVVNPGKERRPGQRLVIRDGHIAKIENATGDADSTDTTARYAGATVVPGLIDMHGHYMPIDRDLFSILFLRHGVTTIRATGNNGRSLLAMRQGQRDGDIAAPRIFTCGAVVDGPWGGSESAPKRDDGEVVVDPGDIRSPEEARAVVDAHAAKGVDCIKVFNHLMPDEMAAVRETAADHGIAVVGHMPGMLTIEEAQIDDIQHLSGLGPFPKRAPTDLPDWFAINAERWENMDVAEVVVASRRAGSAHTPTLVAGVNLFAELKREDDGPSADTGLLPRYYRDGLWRRAKKLLAHGRFDRRIAEGPEVVKALHAGGVRVHVGTDTPNPFVVPGLSVQQELELFVRAGLTIDEAWVAGTRWAGEFLGVPGLGTITPGAPADFLIFREDPTLDLKALNTLEAVVTGGRLYPVEELEEALARQRRRFESAPFDVVTLWSVNTVLEVLNLPPLPEHN